VQEHTSDLGCGLGHENARAGEASHRQRQRADVILMRVRNKYRLDLTVGDCLEIRQRVFPGIFRVHSAIEQEPMGSNLKIVRIRADLRAPGQINEFQMRFPSASNPS
jgi:hypothetical protein